MKILLKLKKILKNNNRILNVLKITFLCIGVFFLFLQMREVDYTLLNNIKLIDLIVASLLIFLGTTFFAIPWSEEYKKDDIEIKNLEYIKFYFQGQLGKYIPGSIWSIAGRIGLASNKRISLKDSAYKTTKHLIQLWLTCFLVGSIFYFNKLYITIFAILLFIYSLKKNLYLFFYILGWLMICVSYLFISNLFLYENLNVFKIFSSTLYSWFGGFIFLPAPSGIGVREFLFTFIYDESIIYEKLFLISMIMRVLTVFNDTFGFFFYSILHKVLGNK